MGRVIQTLCALAVSFGGFIIGTLVAWPIAVEDNVVKKQAYGFYVSADEFHWIDLTLPVAAIVGCIIAGILLNPIGRKITILLSFAPYIAGYIVLILAKNVLMLLCARAALGVAAGMLSVGVPIYVGEVAEVEVRGRLLSLFYMLYLFGLLVMFSFGPYVKMLILNVTLFVVTVFVSALMMVVPETPVYLTLKPVESQAKAIGDILHSSGDSTSLRGEEYIAACGTIKEFNPNPFKDSVGFRSILIITCMMFFQQTCGIQCIMYYAKPCFHYGSRSLSSEAVLIIITAMRIPCVFIPTFLVDLIGRRILLFSSILLVALTSAAISVFFLLKESDPNTTRMIREMLIVLFLIFLLSYDMGFGPIPWILVGELCTADVKPLGATVAVVVHWLFYFLTALGAPEIANAIGMGESFIINSLLAVFGLLFVMFCVIETRQRSRLSIVVALRGSGSKSDSRYY